MASGSDSDDGHHAEAKHESSDSTEAETHGQTDFQKDEEKGETERRVARLR